MMCCVVASYVAAKQITSSVINSWGGGRSDERVSSYGRCDLCGQLRPVHHRFRNGKFSDRI